MIVWGYMIMSAVDLGCQSRWMKLGMKSVVSCLPWVFRNRTQALCISNTQS